MQGRSRKRWLLLACLLLLLLGAVWACWPDRNLSRAKDLRKELFSPAARSMPAEQRRQKWQELRQIQEQLSPAQRQLLSAESRKRQQAEMARYFRLSPQEKTRYLDEMIRRSEKMRQQLQARAGAGPAGAGPGRGPGGPGGFGGGPRGGGPGGAAGGRGTRAREERRQNRLDSSTPAERAQVNQFLKDLTTRRAQLGLPAGGRGFGPPR